MNIGPIKASRDDLLKFLNDVMNKVDQKKDEDLFDKLDSAFDESDKYFQKFFKEVQNKYNF